MPGLLGLVAAIVFTGLPRSATAWEVRDLDVHVTVLPDARLKVVETIHANFGPERQPGITRIIPLSFPDPYGYRNIDVRLLAVTDAEGRRWPSRVTRSDRELRVWIGPGDGFFTGEQLFVLTYEADGAILDGPTRDELFWQVTGYRWDVPIIEARAVVELPPGIDLKELDASSVIGKFGAPGRPSDLRTLDPSRAVFIVKRGLVPREGFLVSLAWQSGLVRHQSAVEQALRGAGRSVLRLLPLVLGLAVLVGWWRFRRRRPGGAAAPPNGTKPPASPPA